MTKLIGDEASIPSDTEVVHIPFERGAPYPGIFIFTQVCGCRLRHGKLPRRLGLAWGISPPPLSSFSSPPPKKFKDREP